MTRFCDLAWQHTAPLRAAIDKLPFNRELAAGTLSRERFQGYITQDALYLDQYARTLAIAGAPEPGGVTVAEILTVVLLPSLRVLPVLVDWEAMVMEAEVPAGGAAASAAPAMYGVARNVSAPTDPTPRRLHVPDVRDM